MADWRTRGRHKLTKVELLQRLVSIGVDLEDAEAEIERLRAALKEIAAFEGPFLASTAYVMWHKARDAIAVEQSKEPTP